MKLDKAIKVGERCKNGRLSIGQFEDADAIGLGIEALKSWKRLQVEWRRPATMRLPGETEE